MTQPTSFQVRSVAYMLVINPRARGMVDVFVSNAHC